LIFRHEQNKNPAKQFPHRFVAEIDNLEEATADIKEIVDWCKTCSNDQPGYHNSWDHETCRVFDQRMLPISNGSWIPFDVNDLQLTWTGSQFRVYTQDDKFAMLFRTAHACYTAGTYGT
jgi:hypothetical protein